MRAKIEKRKYSNQISHYKLAAKPILCRASPLGIGFWGQLTALVLAGIAFLHPANATERPSQMVNWSDASIERLPEELRNIARLHLTEKDKIREDSSDERLEWLSLVHMMDTREGLVSVIGVLEETEDPGLRLVISRWLSESGGYFAWFDEGDNVFANAEVSYPKRGYELSGRAARAIEKAIKLAETPSESTELTQYFMKFQARRIWGLYYAKVPKTIESFGQEAADPLRLQMKGLFHKGVLPDFMYREFPALRVDGPTKGPLRVVGLGDFGTGRPAQLKTAAAIQREHSKRPFNLGITLGDNFLPDGLDDPAHPRWRTQWEDLYGPFGITFYPALGNHDYHAEGSALAAIAYSDRSESWELLAPNYSVHAGDAAFFALDTNVVLEDQLDWLRGALAETDAAWKIVYAHHPIFSSGYKADREPINLVDRLLPVLIEGGADAYIAGHAHTMEEWAPQDGVHFFIAGPGGSSPRDADPGAESVFHAAEYGFLTLEITEETLTVQFINADNELVHERIITRR